MLKATLKQRITFGCLTLLIISASILLIHYRHSKNVSDFSDQYIYQLNNSIQETIRNYMVPAQTAAKTASKLFAGGTLTMNGQGLDSFVTPLADEYPQLRGFFVGLENDDFWFWLKTNDDRGHHLITTMQATKDVTIPTSMPARELPARLPATPEHESDAKRKARTQIYRYFDASGNETHAEYLHSPSYFPTKRPWYKGAKSIKDNYWTDVYIFATLKVLGVTASYPLFDEGGDIVGVWGVDIVLEELSGFLRELAAPRFGEIVIINAQEQVVAYSGDIGSENREQLISVDDIKSPTIRQAISSYRKHGLREFLYESDNTHYLASVSPLSFANSDEWDIVIILPESDLLEKMQSTLMMSSIYMIVVCALCFIVLIRLYSPFSFFKQTD